MSKSIDLKQCLEVAKRAAKEGGALALKYFKSQDFQKWDKPDDSPVTEADHEVEKVLRKHLEPAFPEHRIIGEEFGVSGPDSGWDWWLDPIDGTRSFISGGTSWAVLIALVYQGVPKLGLIFMPVLDRWFLALEGEGAFDLEHQALTPEHGMEILDLWGLTLEDIERAPDFTPKPWDIAPLNIIYRELDFIEEERFQKLSFGDHALQEAIDHYFSQVNQ